MKKILTFVLIITLSLSLLCGCNIFPNEKNSVGKAANTVITTYTALQENFALRKKSGYNLYGVKLSVDSENVGTYTYIYTDKRPDDMKYSDILVVRINSLNGKIEKFSAPEFEDYGTEPYEMIKSAMPLTLTSFAIDSDAAIKIASDHHFSNNFIYNFLEIVVIYENGAPVYKIKHISLVNECIYYTVVDAMTGAVVTDAVEELV